MRRRNQYATSSLSQVVAVTANTSNATGCDVYVETGMTIYCDTTMVCF